MLKKLLYKHFWIAYSFFIIGIFFGILYSIQLLNNLTFIFRPDLTRSLHISLMLYGFLPLMVTMLPFTLIDKEISLPIQSTQNIERFFYIWYIFLLFLIISITYGNTRGLPFYDFSYELNFLLAIAGFFYIRAFLYAIKKYQIKPLWIKITLFIILISPLALLILMNPQYGQVEKTLIGPHGDNTLGMSFALLMLYYLIIKLESPLIKFKTKWHILWITPLTFYIISIIYRLFIGNLTYNMEWFFQSLTLLYLPLLYRWWKDANLSIKKNLYLLISILAFIFADIEGNILFIPKIRELFHRNDLVIGHAHIAVALNLLFLVMAIFKRYVNISKTLLFTTALLLIAMAIVLSISGFEQAGFFPLHTHFWWTLRSIIGGVFGLIIVIIIINNIYMSLRAIKFDFLTLFNLIGFLSDGLGGIILIIFAPFIYHLLHLNFSYGYLQIVFSFVTAVGVVHLIGLINQKNTDCYATATSIIRSFVSAMFFALYKAKILNWIGLFLSVYDLLFVLTYITYKRRF